MRKIVCTYLLIAIFGFTISDNVIRMLKGHEWSITDIEINKGGDVLISGGWDKTLRIWSLENYSEIYCF